MKRYFCTYFDRNYLYKAMALIESLTAHAEADFHLFIVCLDEITRTLLKRMQLPNISLIPLHEIEARDLPLLTARGNRSLVEYYWTLTPTVILRLLERNPEVDILTYLDADLYFFSSPEPIFEELGTGSVLVHEHRFTPEFEKKFLVNGRFNVGLLCFKRDSRGLQVLQWWRDRCNEWCYARNEQGKFGDQAYLDEWPSRFEGVVISQNEGVGVAPWNQGGLVFSTGPNGSPLVNNKPLIFYHFHNFKMLSPQFAVPITGVEYPLSVEILKLCVVPYLNSILRGTSRILKLHSKFGCGFWQIEPGSSGVNLEQTFVVSTEAVHHFNSIGLPHRQINLDGRWHCFASQRQMNLEAVS